MKLKIFSPVRNLLRMLVDNPAQDPSDAAPAHPTVAPERRTATAFRPRAVPARPTSARQNGRGVELPLQPIFASLPTELQPRLIQADPGPLTICIPLEKVLAQLSRGSVQISFGELRQAAPDCFSPENDRDRMLVPLPLGEILARLNPALIARRRTQRQVDVPLEIASPFDPHSRGLIFSVGPAKPPSAPAPGPMQPKRQVTPPAPTPAPAPSRTGFTFTPTPKLPAATPPVTPTRNSAARSPQVPASRPLPLPKLTPAAQAPTPPAPTPAAPAPIAPAPAAPPPAAPAAAVPAPAAASAAPGPVAPTPTPVKPAADPNPILVSLTSLAESWPEAIRQELVQLNLVDARVALPSHIAERTLKQGRVAFTWKSLRSWIRPTPLPTVSVHDSTVLDLPLNVVAPLFLARQQQPAKGQKKVAVDADIPNLFFSFPQPESAAAAPTPPSPPPAKQEDTNFYVWDDTSDTVRFAADEVRRAPSAATRFVAKYATPNEVVSRAAALDHVAGALIALPDGLMVASRLSPDLNGETLAAFLPQIFGKISQCTKELRMGDLNNVSFTVGNVPWKIFRVNAIFFAAFGRAGQPLPAAPLAALAAELDHKPR
jgi:predicted regulator of Ras-like GTPase activity (Roadblock/LC7/MglB family)